MRAWSLFRIHRLAMALLFAAGLVCIGASISFDTASARTRDPVEMGDPDSGDNKPGTGPSRLAAPVNNPGAYSEPRYLSSAAAVQNKWPISWHRRAALAWTVFRLTFGR